MFPPTLLLFAAVSTILIMVAGICGNTLTIVALLSCAKVRNIAATFIINLCLADLLFCLIVLPFNAHRFLTGTWTHGDVLCKLIPFIQYGNIGVSLLCITMITINRYVMIAHNSFYSKIYKTRWIAMMITFCWLFSYGMQVPTLFGIWGVFDYDPKLETCSIMNDASGRSSKTALFIIAFLIPCAIIIICYTRIFWVVHKSEKTMKQHSFSQNSILNNQRDKAPSNLIGSVNSIQPNEKSTDSDDKSNFQSASVLKTRNNFKMRRNEWRITKMVLVIFFSFVLCYLPITLVKVFDKNVDSPTAHILSYIMLYLSACINPFLYVIMNKQYRKAYKSILTCNYSQLFPCLHKGANTREQWRDSRYQHNTFISQVPAAETDDILITNVAQNPTKN